MPLTEGRNTLRAAALAAALLVPCASGSVAGAQGEHVAADLTPDEVEALTAELEPWFGALRAALAEGPDVSALGLETVRGLDADAGFDEVFHGGGPRPPWAEAAHGDSAWLGIPAGLPGPGGVQLKTKVVGVRVPRVGRATLDLRIEAARRDGDAPATAQVTLHTVLDVEAGEDGWQPRALGLQRIEGAVRDAAPLFVERTRGLLAKDPDAARVLGLGLDRWAQRLDDPGLTAWFGHQGLAAGDLTGDGLPDLYVGMPSGVPNLLLVQQPDGSVRDEARRYGLAWLDDTKGVLLDDVDGDGRVDAVTSLGHVLAVQTADRRVPPGVEPPDALPVVGWCVAPDEAPFYSIASADLDGDGWHEIFGTRYVRTRYVDSVPIPFDEARNGPESCLFRFDGQRFRDIAAEVGLVDDEGGRFSLAASFVDVDGDRRDDLYVVNDFGSNQLFVRGEGLSFTERAAEFGLDDAGAGMGASWGDVDGDGDLDVYVTNMFSSAGQRVAFRDSFGEGLAPARIDGARALTEGSALLVRADAGFERFRGPWAPTMGRWGWGGVLCDVDRDGLDDVIAPAGFLTGPKPGDL